MSLGNQYVVGLKAENCRSGDSLAEEQETAEGKEKVLRALSQAATKLRGKLGESLKSIEKFDAPLELATTSSLPALQAYSLGRKTFMGADRSPRFHLFSGPRSSIRALLKLMLYLR